MYDKPGNDENYIEMKNNYLLNKKTEWNIYKWKIIKNLNLISLIIKSFM